MCVYIYISIYSYMCIHTYKCIHIYIYACVNVCMCVPVYTCAVFVCAPVRVLLSVYASQRICLLPFSRTTTPPSTTTPSPCSCWSSTCPSTCAAKRPVAHPSAHRALHGTPMSSVPSLSVFRGKEQCTSSRSHFPCHVPVPGQPPPQGQGTFPCLLRVRLVQRNPHVHTHTHTHIHTHAGTPAQTQRNAHTRTPTKMHSDSCQLTGGLWLYNSKNIRKQCETNVF